MSHKVRSQYSRTDQSYQEGRCNICSFMQKPPAAPRLVVHQHNSAKEVRVLQGVEEANNNKPYMCPTCSATHLARPPGGLNLVVGDGNLHSIHNPRNSRTRCPPDPLHIDWMTIPNATIPELELAWSVEYENCQQPMRILLSAGTADLARGRSRDQIVESIMHFRYLVSEQNKLHPSSENDFVVGTVLNPPKLVRFPVDGKPSTRNINFLAELKELNAWIIYFNDQKGKITPRFHRLGIKNGFRNDKDGNKVKVHCHILSQWSQDEPNGQKMHLSQPLKVKMGTMVTKHFLGELERMGPISPV